MDPRLPSTATTTLRKPLRRALLQGHPWIWRDALDRLAAAPGEIVTVLDDRRRFVARGLAEAGPIGVRVWTTVDEPIDDALVARRIRAADALRRRVVPPATDAFRLLHGEGDRVPGFVCDIYGGWASVQLDGEAAGVWRARLLDALAPVLHERGCDGLVVRTGRRGRRSVEVVRGGEPPARLMVREHGMQLLVDLVRGQKTGLFLDHREARSQLRAWAQGLRVLDLYAYVGGFSAAAGLGGAQSVDTVDVAPEAIALSEAVWHANGLGHVRRVAHVEDVFEFLAGARAQRQTWDLIVADPPSFAPNESSRADALAAYARLHEAALRVLEPGGILLAASCSSHVRALEFEGALQQGASAARRAVGVLARHGGGADHPRLLAFPEGDYLKVIWARVW